MGLEWCIAKPGTIDGVAEIGFGGDVEALLVGGLESGGEGVALGALDEVDGAAAEAAAGEPGSEAAGEGGWRCRRGSRFRRSCIAKSSRSLAWPASMSLPKATGSPANMALRASRTRALSEMMWRQRRKAASDISELSGFELVEGGFTEVADTGFLDEDGLAFFGLAAAHAVFAGGDGVFDHGVADDDLGVGEGSLVHGEVFVGEVAGVEEKGVAGFGGGDDELVHDATGGVDVVVFGALGEEGDVFDGEFGAGEARAWPWRWRLRWRRKS